MVVRIGSLALLFTALLACRGQALIYKGANLSGAEWGYLGGAVYGTDYLYPAQSEVDDLLARGMNTFRLPFRWERLQPSPAGNFEATEWSRLKTFVDETTSKGAHVILDPHNYGYYYGSGIGTSWVTNDTFNDLWSRLATAFADNDRVIFGLMNEPTMPTTETWRTNAQLALNAIRSTGAQNLVLVPGNGYTGAWSWVNGAWYGTANGSVMTSISDPGHNFAFEVHQYLDWGHDGNGAEIAYDGATMLADFTGWLRKNGFRGFLGEFAVAAGNTQAQALTGMLDHLEANADVWTGWTVWGGGPLWRDDYMFRLRSVNGVDAPQLATLAPYLPVPEPGPAALLALALLPLAAGLILRRRPAELRP